MEFVYFFDKYYNLDLVAQLPVLQKAVTGVAQYLFPNGYYAAFGDSHYGRISLQAANRMVANARKNNKPQQELYFTRYIKAMQPWALADNKRTRPINALLFPDASIRLKDVTGDLSEFVTPLLSSSHVSFVAMRNGMDSTHGLMVALSGSNGNHMHAGGIAMELYGKGYMLAPESGIGTSYFQTDYAEYYSQFPAHNTVTVDGISAYPVMRSNHAFEVRSAYPASGVSKGFFPFVNFCDLYFLEPETNSDQQRLMSIIRTSDTSGYYIDLFRSRRKDGKDKMHDYFYHNMGQQLQLLDVDALQPTDELSFGGGHLAAYDHFYDKRSITTDKNIHAVFSLAIAAKDTVQMHLWMKGEKDRTIFSVKSPASKAIDRMGLPTEIVDLPLPTLVARQRGEAWTRPFTVVFEPAKAGRSSIQSVTYFNNGLTVQNLSGSTQYIFYGDSGKQFKGRYGVISESRTGLQYLFLGNGQFVSRAGYSITATKNTTAALCKQGNDWYYTSSHPVTITLPGQRLRLPAKAYTKITF